MICYKDRTFCVDPCANLRCDRNGYHVPMDALLPVAWADFSGRCDNYQPQSRGGGKNE